jgi:DNA-binding transcriptional regulator LsrR (DeoR family)
MYHLPMSRVERIVNELKEQGYILVNQKEPFDESRNAQRLARALKRSGVEVPDDRKDKNNG